jgi:hypothetical protein
MAKSYRELKEEKRRKRNESYKERKNRALKEGSLTLFITCPLCGLNRPLKRWGKAIEFIVKPDYFLIQGRRSHGKGSGFFLSDQDSLKINQVKEKHPELYNNIRSCIKELNKIFK